MTDTTSDIDLLLAPFHQFGVNLGLSRIQTLLAAMGSPHTSVPIVHVAGTNGKGSVCAYLSSVLSAAGYKVGRYTSPHLVNWNERICIDGEPISTDRAVTAIQQAIAAIDPNLPTPTQFEIVTAAAWLYFAQSQVDIAIIEVGLGGRLDATNVIDRPLASSYYLDLDRSLATTRRYDFQNYYRKSWHPQTQLPRNYRHSPPRGDRGSHHQDR